MTATLRKNKSEKILAILFKITFGILFSVIFALFSSSLEGQPFLFYFLIALTISTGIFFLGEISKRYDKFPVFDLGYIYTVVILLYFIYPIIKFIAFGYSWNLLSDVRLVYHAPNSVDLEKLLFYYFVYLASFCYFYLFNINRRLSLSASAVKPTPISTKKAFYFLLILMAFNHILSGIIGVESEYSNQITSLESQPLIIRQLYFFLQSSIFGFGLFVLLISGLRYKANRFYFWAVLALYIAPVVVAMGSRHTAVAYSFAGIVIYHLYIKAIPKYRLIMTCIFLLMTFLIWGALRSYSVGDIGYLTSTEFDAMFATFYEVSMDSHSNVPLAVYFSDLLSIIPQQFLPFEKIDPGTWYMKEYFSEAFEENPQMGYGFGVISEAAIGFGYVELIIRGAMHGILFSFMMNYLSEKKVSVFIVCIYLFCLITIFRTFRTTSFELIKSMLFSMGPALMILYLYTKSFKRSSSG